jgi:hypothetical protein
MKRLIWVAGLLLCSVAGLHAQSSGGAGNGSRNTAAVSASGSGSGALHTRKERKVVRNKKGQKRVVTRTVPLQEEKNYKWKNGQTATPTGNDAAPVNGQGYTAPRKDSLYRKER